MIDTLQNAGTVGSYLIGTENTGFFIAKLLLAYLGAFLLILWGAQKGVKSAEYSPPHFSWKYLWCDNNKRIIANLIVIYIGVRFMSELMPPTVNENMELFTSLLVGLSVDAIAAKLKKWKNKK